VNPQWQPPTQPPLPPEKSGHSGRPPRSRWLPAAIVTAAILVAGAVIAGALILRDSRADSAGAAETTCQAWTETRQTLRSIPALPSGWTWDTPDIDTYISNQNAPVGQALDSFEPKIAETPADVALAAEKYIAARRQQMRSLADRSYTPADGKAVDTALSNLNQLCGIDDSGRRI